MKISPPVAPVLGNVDTNFGFSTRFCFQAKSRKRKTDRQSDGQTDRLQTDGQDP